MRSTADHNQATVSFDRDTPRGLVVVCGFCGNYFELHNDVPGEKQDCPRCQRELLLPSWCDW